MALKNAKFYKRDLKGNCWYSGYTHKSEGVMIFLNSDEIPVCFECYKKHSHFVRNSKPKVEQQSLKISDKDIEKNQESNIQEARQ